MSPRTSRGRTARAKARFDPLRRTISRALAVDGFKRRREVRQSAKGVGGGRLISNIEEAAYHRAKKGVPTEYTENTEIQKAEIAAAGSKIHGKRGSREYQNRAQKHSQGHSNHGAGTSFSRILPCVPQAFFAGSE
jgi:hypothetical protein